MIDIHRDRPLIMGILNVTPDSFSDGGSYTSVDAAVKQAIIMVKEGADLIDIGGESTRPGSSRVPADEQKKRVIDIIQAVRESVPATTGISIDTTLSEVADKAISAGACMVNDISAGRDDPDMFALIADRKCPYVMMHMQGSPATMQDNPDYGDVVNDIREMLTTTLEQAAKSGISKDSIIIDPGIGFGKTRDHNLQIIANLKSFVALGQPVLLGTSRKRFMGAICEGAGTDQLIGATCATTTIGVYAGVNIFRVHDVLENRQAADVAWHTLRAVK